MLFPKDANAGGTWIGTSDKKRLVCVLNGGFVKHERKSSYTRSRGLIAKELLQANSVNTCVNTLNLSGVEPFTMVIVDWSASELALYELVWDEATKHFSQLPNEPRIWSSSTLYENASKDMRKKWFEQWLVDSKITQDQILRFHHSTEGDPTQSILMKRSYVETVSITSVQKIADNLTMHYEDLVENRTIMVPF